MFGSVTVIKYLLVIINTKIPTFKTLSEISHAINKQLLDEVQHDIVNYQNRGLCYLSKRKAEAGNIDTRF